MDGNAASTKAGSVWNIVLIAVLGFFCIILIVALAAGIAIHVNIQSQWQKVHDNITMENAKLAESLKNSTSLRNSEIDELSVLAGKLMNTEDRMNKLENKSQNVCERMYNGKCYWLDMHYTPFHQFTYYNATANCAAEGGSPANIYSHEHYDWMLGNLRLYSGTNGYSHAWIGMTYNVERNETLLRNGTVAPYTKYHVGYPDRSLCCNMILKALPEWNDAGQHIFIQDQSYRFTEGVYCEKQL